MPKKKKIGKLKGDLLCLARTTFHDFFIFCEFERFFPKITIKNLLWHTVVVHYFSSGYIRIKEAFVFNLEYSHDQQSVKKSLSSLQPFTERLFSLRNMRFVGCICLADFLYLTASLPLHSVLWKARAQSQIESWKSHLHI